MKSVQSVMQKDLVSKPNARGIVISEAVFMTSNRSQLLPLWEKWGEGGKERRSPHQPAVSYKGQTKYKLALATQSLYQILDDQPLGQTHISI